MAPTFPIRENITIPDSPLLKNVVDHVLNGSQALMSSAIRNTTTNAALQQIPNHGHASLDGHCQQTPDGLKPQGSTFNPTFVHGFFLGLIVATSAWAIVWAAKRTCLSDRVPEVKQTGEEEREEQEEQENAQKPARRAFKGPC